MSKPIVLIFAVLTAILAGGCAGATYSDNERSRSSGGHSH